MEPLVLSSATVIAAEPARVWSILVDVGRWPAWCSPVRRASPPREVVPGAQFAFVLVLDPGVRVTFRVTVDEARPGERLCWSSTKWWGVEATRCFVLTPQNGATHVEDRKTFRSRIWPVAVAYPRRSVLRMSEHWLADLRAEAERRGT